MHKLKKKIHTHGHRIHNTFSIRYDNRVASYNSCYLRNLSMKEHCMAYTDEYLKVGFILNILAHCELKKEII